MCAWDVPCRCVCDVKALPLWCIFCSQYGIFYEFFHADNFLERCVTKLLQLLGLFLVPVRIVRGPSHSLTHPVLVAPFPCSFQRTI